MIVDPEIKEFIRNHKNEDVRKLALKKSQLSSDMHTFVLQQIAGWQIASKKVPSWASVDDFIYPPHLSLEQCSSEQTAKYKTSLLQPANSYADLTGGMGVDFCYMSAKFPQRWFVEQNKSLCEIAQHNFAVLGIDVSVCNEEASSFLQTCQAFDCIYLDPARRDSKGRKMISIADCTPNLLEIKDLLLSKCDSAWIKYSPMLDISVAMNELKSVDQIHVVSVNNECKELLFHLTKQHETSPTITCVNLKKNNEQEIFSYLWEDENTSVFHSASQIETYLYEPNASILKAGAFKIICQRFNVKKLSLNSHLYTSDTYIDDFPGRKFKVEASLSMNKQQIKEHLQDCHQANITTRNFPLSVEQLRSKLKITDGGDVYLFATIFQDQKILLKTFAIR